MIGDHEVEAGIAKWQVLRAAGHQGGLNPELVEAATSMNQLAVGDIYAGCAGTLLREPGGPLRATAAELEDVETSNVRQDSELGLRKAPRSPGSGVFRDDGPVTGLVAIACPVP